MKYKITTDIKENRFIESEIVEMDYDNIVYRNMKQVLDIQEEQVKQSLIKLGWIPPKD
jgi:23S rRNA maturation-related 3'-5' exoribonuclease YhaM